MTQAKPPQSRLRKAVVLAIKIAGVSVLFYFLFKRGMISMQATRQAFGQWQILLPAMLLLVLNTLAGVVRWQWILRAQNIHLSLWRTFQLSYIGNFFNIALPGAVSGDFVKAYYVSHEMHGRKSLAFGTILFDRVLGLSALAMVSAGAFLADFDKFRGTPLFALQFFIILAASVVVLFYAYLFLVPEGYDPLLILFRWLEARVSIFASLTRVYETVRYYRHFKWMVCKALMMSIVVHVIVSWACMRFAYALGEPSVPMLSCMVTVPLGLLVTAIPVLPAGVGTGHVAFAYLFQLFGSQRGADVYTLLALTNIFIGALGGLVYLRFRAKDPLPPKS